MRGKNMKKLLPLLVVGTLILSGFGVTATSIWNKNSFNIDEKNSGNIDTLGDELDQYQTGQNWFSPVGVFPLVPNVNYSVAQSFVPQKKFITGVQLYIDKNSTTTYPYILAIREELTGENLAVSTIDPEDVVTENYSWIDFDFNYLPLTVNQTYYLVSYTANVTDNFYTWGANLSNPYPNGTASVSIDDGKTWSSDPNLDMCFKTYGRDDAPDLETEFKGGIGLSLVINNVGDGDATGVKFSLSVTGGVLGFINESADGMIISIPVGETFTYDMPLMGLGSIDIVATVEDVTVTGSGFVFLFFVIVR